ncbi:NRAMP family divalent metal transporter [Candidatus Hecatella orcuttiae]|uniref:NRAMP family divalent metal transporter n=1 Tax=Candidatus Hecatella orcuttiae TaxID=1935119 RepID=UPI0028682F1E|nr:divalent metal cation transporter [Candidatus Hecatella orcuttiae]
MKTAKRGKKAKRGIFPRAKRVRHLLWLVAPGLIVGSAGNDAASIGSLASAGALYGHSVLWALLLALVFSVFIQDMCVRIAVGTGKGLIEHARERFGIRVGFTYLLGLLTVNFATIVAQIAGMAAGLELLLGSLGLYTPYVVLSPILAFSVWAFLLKKGYSPVERIFSVVSLTLLAYVAVAFMAKPSPEAVAAGTFWIVHKPTPDYLLFSAAVIGATISPYMQFYLTSALVDKGVKLKDLKLGRTGSVLGITVSGIEAFAIVVVTATVLHPLGITVDTPRDAALALFPYLGAATFILFSIGFFASSVIGTGVVVSSSGYAFGEFFGVERGLNKKVAEAFHFYLTFTACFIIGYAVLLLGVTPIQAMVYSMVISFIFSPLVMLLILTTANSRELLRDAANKMHFRAAGWLIFGVLLVLDAFLISTFLAGLF